MPPASFPSWNPYEATVVGTPPDVSYKWGESRGLSPEVLKLNFNKDLTGIPQAKIFNIADSEGGIRGDILRVRRLFDRLVPGTLAARRCGKHDGHDGGQRLAGCILLNCYHAVALPVATRLFNLHRYTRIAPGRGVLPERS